MENAIKYINDTVKLFKGEMTPPAITEHIEEVARGAAILDAYTNWHFRHTDIYTCLDDSYAALNAYVYGAIILAPTFGTADFYDYYDDYVKSVIVPALTLIKHS